MRKFKWLVAVCVVLAGLTFAAPAFADPPPNDNFANATAIAGPTGSIAGTTIGATNEAAEPALGHSVGVWYAWTALSSGQVDFDLCGASYDTYLDVFTGPDLSSLTLVASNDDSCGVSSHVLFAFTGQTYWIRVGGYSSSVGTFTMHWNVAAPPANDDLEHAQAISGASGNVAGTTAHSTSQVGEPDNANGVWYRWTAPADGTYRFSCTLSDSGGLQAFGGTGFADFTRLGSGCPLDLTVHSGDVVYLRVSTFGTGASFTLTWRSLAPPVGPGALVPCSNTDALPRNDDGSSGVVGLPFLLDFFGSQFNQLYVNNNGNVTFNGPMSTYTPFTLGAATPPIIAPFFADVDTRNPESDVVRWGTTTFNGRQAFCVNWAGVGIGYYGSHADPLNSFQLLLVDRSDTGHTGDFDIVFNYAQILWETGDASGGHGGLGGTSAGAGYSAGTGDPSSFFSLPGSLTPGSFLDSNLSTGLIHNGTGLQLGRYVYPVRNGSAPTGGTIDGTVRSGVTPQANAPVQLCRATGGCYARFTSGAGTFSYAGLDPGDYTLIAYPPASAAGDLPSPLVHVTLPANGHLTQDLQLQHQQGVPADVTFGPTNGTSGVVPVVYWHSTLTLTKSNRCTGGTGEYAIVLGGSVVRSGPMTETPPGSGTYTATIAELYPNHGAGSVQMTIHCPGGVDDVQEFSVYVDPSGTVATVTGAVLPGATVTLYRSETGLPGTFEQVPNGSAIMSPSNRSNPDTTDAAGHFHWDVIAGYYIVRAQKDGCSSPDHLQSFVESAVLTIPPAVIDLDLRLACAAADTSAPMLTLPPNITAEATSHDGASVHFDASATDDHDGSVPVTCSPASDSTFPLGDTTVSCRATDSAGNLATASFHVNVVDTTRPSITCPAGITAEATGNGAATVTPGAASASDAVGPVTVSGPAAGSYPLGQTTVTYTATDGAGNTASCTTTITVVDTTPPSIACPTPITAEATGPSGAAVTPGNATASDIAGPVTISGPAAGTYPLGNTVVTYTATDASNNQSSCQTLITVVDTTPPTISCPAGITAEATGNGAAAVTPGTATASDLVGPVTVSGPAAGSYPLGVTTVTYTAKDAAGNTASCTTTITVVDTTPPAITCPATLTVEGGVPGGAFVTPADATATDSGGPVSVSGPVPAIYPLGDTTVTYTAIDESGNTASCTSTIRVVDTTPPSITCPAPKTVEATGPATSVTAGTATAFDLVSTPTITGPTGAVSLPLGTTTLAYTATDGSGNKSSCATTITVVDTTPPSITCPAPKTAEATGPSGAAVTPSAATATDLVGPVTISGPAAGTYPLGTTPVTYTATDEAGNTSSCTSSISVVDTTAPTVTVPANKTVDATSPAGAVVTFTASARDLVSGTLTPTCSPASGSTFAAASTTTVTCTATDAAGNTGSASFTIHVRGADELLAKLIADSTGVPPGTSLADKARQARSYFAAGDVPDACSTLAADLNEVRAQTGKKLTSAQAALLTTDVNKARAALGC